MMRGLIILVLILVNINSFSQCEIFSENFSAYAVGNVSDAGPTYIYENNSNVACVDADGWRVSTSNADGTSCTGCSGNRAVIDYGGSGCDQDATLIIGSFVPSSNSINVSFNYGYDQFDATDVFHVYLYNKTTSTPGPDMVNLAPGTDCDNCSYGPTARAVTSGDTYEIRVRYVGDYGWGATVDNFSVTEDTDNDSRIQAGALSEPAIISSIADQNSEDVAVFDFILEDLGSGDGYATIIDQLIITQGTGNDIGTWTNAIAGAYLNGPDQTDMAGTINATNITFSGVDFISVADGTNETYTLSIWLKTSMTGVNEGDNLVFKISDTDITEDACSSTFNTYSEESGALNVAIDVVASDLAFNQQPSNTIKNSNMTPSVTVYGVDENGNLDTDYTGTVNITSTGTLSSAQSETAVGGVATFASIAHSATGVALVLTATDVSPDPDWTDNSSVFNITLPTYCASNATSSLDSRIARVRLVGESVTIDESTACQAETYTDNTGVTPADVNQGGSYTIEVTNGTDCAGDFSRSCNVWVDFNQDGDFSDANEQILGTASTNSTTGYVHSVAMTVPATALLGETMMRVVIEESGTPTACGTYTYGETEDYLIDIISPCSTPTSAPTTSATAYVSNTSASITYDATGITNGDEVLVVCRETSTGAVAPTDGQDYATATNSFSGAVATTGAGNVVIYQGTDLNTSKTVVDLTCTNDYTFDVYARNSSGDCYSAVASINYTAKRLCSITYNQASVADVNQSQTDVELYRVDLSVGGSTGNLRFNSIQFASENDADSDVASSSVKLYRTSAATFATTNQVGSSQSFAGGFVNFNSGTDIPYNLPNGTTYLWLAVDAAAGATIGNLLDVSLAANAMDVEGTTYPSSAQNPAGARTIVSAENNGFKVSGNIVNTGTWNHFASDESSSPTEYIMVSGSGTISGDAGNYNQVWMQVDGDISFSATNMTGEVEKTIVSNGFSLSVTGASANINYRTGWFKNNGTVDLANGNSKIISTGDFINSNVLSADAASTIEFIGSVNQNVQSNGDEMGGVTFNNSTAGTAITLLDNMTTNGVVTFTDGIVASTQTEMLIHNDGSTVAGASDNSYVDGPVRKFGTIAFTFPVGDDNNYQPIGITAPSVATDHFTAQYFETDPNVAHAGDAGAPYDNTSLAGTLDHISQCEYWILDRKTGATSNVSVTLAWDGNSCGVTDMAQLAVARWDGAMWQDHNQGGGTTGSNAAGTITSDLVSNFSPFAPASKTPANPLPIELLSFEGKIKSDFNLLEWTTMAEVNVSHFEIERSKNRKDFEFVGRLTAAGNSSEMLQYQLPDWDYYETTFYRLKSVDFSGEEGYSHIIKLDRNSIENNNVNGIDNELLVFPNPANEHVSLVFVGRNDESANITITDALGKVYLQKQVATTDGDNLVPVQLDNMSNGVYFVEVTGSEYSYTKRLVKNR